VTDAEEFPTIRIVQKRLCIFSRRELDDDHPLRPPLALHYSRLHALNDILPRCFSMNAGIAAMYGAKPARS
jgi:hypothetical protein